ASRISRPEFYQRFGTTGVREVCFSSRDEDVAAETIRSRCLPHVGIRVDNFRGSERFTRCEYIGGSFAERARSPAMDSRVRDDLEMNYSPARVFQLARAYSRFSFAIKLALISAGQTASHS